MIYPEIDPIAFSLGPVKVHWYGLTYLFGFAGVWIFGKIRAKKPYSPIPLEGIDDYPSSCLHDFDS